MNDEDLRSLWRDDDVVPEVDVEGIRHAHDKLERQARRGRLREYAGAALVVPPSIYFLASALARGEFVNAAGWGGALLAAVWVVAVMATRGPAPAPQPDRPLVDFVEDYRAALLHFARLNETAPIWYYAPFVPPFVLWGWSTYPGPDGDLAFWWSYYGVAVPSVFVIGIALNLLGARRLRAKARALPRGG